MPVGGSGVPQEGAEDEYSREDRAGRGGRLHAGKVGRDE